jgi:hypothetical protein
LVAHVEGQDPPTHKKSPHDVPTGVAAQTPAPLHRSPFAELLAVSHTLEPQETPAA